MRKFLFCLLSFVVSVGYAQQVATYHFAPHQQVEYGDGFSGLIVERCSFINEEGHPDLPVFGASVLLEPGHEVVSIAIQDVEYYPAVENVNIRPASANFPISKGAPDGYKAVPNPDIYGADKNYPDHIVGGENTSFLRGHAIGSFLIYPVLYNPVQKRAECIKSITVAIYSQPTPRAAEALKFLRNDYSTTERIERIAVASDASILNSYNSLCKRGTNPDYDILIITKEAFTSALGNYITHKNKWGYKVLVKTIEEIKTNYTGKDDAEKMRNCIIDAYINDGISYLMLFGDSYPNSNSPHSSIPYRKLYVNAGGTIDNIPSDMYFACLDGTWDSGDGTWGKPGHDDLNHEIGVGRICADNTGEIATFVTKLIKYQEEPVTDDIKKALMVGEMLNDYPLTWGGDCKDEVAAGGSFNGYTTVGLPSDFTVSTLYERDFNWNTTQLRDHFNNTGAHIVNHLGHSNVNYNMKLVNWDVTNTNFTNDGAQRTLSIVYSQGCLNGSFDNIDDWGYDTGDDCINEIFHKINGGVVANIGNSRYGWYNPGGTNGPSQRFDRYFFDGIFGEHIYTIGDANSYSKDIIQSLVANNSHLRWCCYELTLLGDPSMDIWTDEPTTFDPQYVKAVEKDATEIIVSTGVPHSRVAVFQDNVLIGRGVCDYEGETTLIFDAPFNPATALFSISGHNKYRYEQQGITLMDAPPVRDLQADVEMTVVNLEWKAPDLSGKQNPPTFYSIYRDGAKIATITSDNLNYQDKGKLTPNTTYEYCVRALYADCSSVPVCIPVTTDLYCYAVKNITTSITGKKIILYWSMPDFPPEKYTILRDGEFLKETDQTLLIDNVAKENTVYEYCVIAHYDGCDSDPACKKVTSGVVCGAMDVITANVNVLTVELSWEHISPNQLEQYVITRDGAVIQETTETSLIDVVPEEDTEYQYCITAKFTTCTSDEKCETVKSGMTVGIAPPSPPEREGVRVYPNPTSGLLTICDVRCATSDNRKSEIGQSKIEIFDVMGRIVAVAPVETRHATSLQSEIGQSEIGNRTFDLSKVPAGIYFLRITTEDDVVVRKVVKE
ncbi:MAG: C25 family cysteine peptidase [Bacteroidales bacterium]|nr:C25 family cysteine peptidase [Bacteroidales bacterium]